VEELEMKFKKEEEEMREELEKLIQDKSPGAQPLLLVVRGSHAYGTNVETSDTDYAGVFIQSLDDILGNGYKEQINDDKNDIVIYEVKRFLNLLASNNPTVLELLNTPEDCVVYKHPVFEEVLENREKFITKICAKSFGGYGKMQIQKAKGQNKKQNWVKDKVTRKDVLDFVYVLEGPKSIPWKKWNDGRYEEKFIGVVNVPNAMNVYAVYYDTDAHLYFSENISEETRIILAKQIELLKIRKESGQPMGFGYKGLVKTGEGENVAESNALRLSSIPKGEEPICNIVYNKDVYSEHCKDYKSYEDWLANKNDTRWVDVKSHGQKIDGKNMMHSKRLMSMAREIAEGKGINVRREDAEYLISIRRGVVDLQTLIDEVESEIVEIDKLFEESDLPDSVNQKFVDELLIKIRKSIYNI
jgi:predicted nucleotidyltransferase